MNKESAARFPGFRWWSVWVARGCDLGRIPFAPGTFGSLAGILWFLLLLLPGSLSIYLLGLTLGLASSVWLCGAAERILNETDPGSVILDEIVAMPICFLPWVIRAWLPAHKLPEPSVFLNARTWWITVLLFALFRLFDIWKPWPIRDLQRLPGGWGITVDDVLAAIYVALLSFFFLPERRV